MVKNSENGGDSHNMPEKLPSKFIISKERRVGNSQEGGLRSGLGIQTKSARETVNQGIHPLNNLTSSLLMNLP